MSDHFVSDDGSVMSALGHLLGVTCSHSESSNIACEVERYLAQNPAAVSTLAVDWWRENDQHFPNVACVAKRYLSAPATSVASERLFSAAALIYTDRRNPLMVKRADMLLFVKHNLPLIKILGTEFNSI